MPLVIILVALFGLVNATCWSAIWPLALQNLGGYTKNCVAIVLLFYGLFAGNIQVTNKNNQVFETAKSVNQIAYLMILFFAHKGHTYTG